MHRLILLLVFAGDGGCIKTGRDDGETDKGQGDDVSLAVEGRIRGQEGVRRNDTADVAEA